SLQRRGRADGGGRGGPGGDDRGRQLPLVRRVGREHRAALERGLTKRESAQPVKRGASTIGAATTTSTAPMSQPSPCGRVTSRSSVVPTAPERGRPRSTAH